MVKVSLELLHAELAEVEASRPEMPRGLDSSHPQFVAWHKAFSKYATRKARIESKITAFLNPVETRKRQERPLAALPAPRLRMRQ